MVDILFRERLHELRLDALQLTELGEVTQLLGHDRAVGALLEDEDVHDADDAGVMEAEELVGALPGEVLVPHRELHDQIVDGPELVDGSLGHAASIRLTGLTILPQPPRRGIPP